MEYLDKQEVVAKIARGETIEIQEEVRVQFDNAQQSPLGFRYRGQHYEVLEVLDTHQEPRGYYHYLVRTYGGVYNLIMMRYHPEAPVSQGKWILNFQVAEDWLPEDAPAVCQCYPGELGSVGGGTALVTSELLCVVNFHGHLCPELAIGYRAAKLALTRLKFDRSQAVDQKVVAYNSGPAVDALQYLTGCTVGKQNLLLYDEGRHQYEFITAEGVLQLVANPSIWEAKTSPGAIEDKIMAGEATQREVNSYRGAIDRVIEEILHLPDEELFHSKWLLGQGQ